MADPLTWASMALTVAGSAVSAYGSIQQGKAQQQALNYDAQVQQQNAQVALEQRQQDITTANLQAQDQNRNNVRRLAAIRASYGNSGIEMAGSALDVLTDTSQGMALDSRRISYEGQVKGRSDALSFLGYQDQATMDTTAGKNAVQAGYEGAGSSLLGGAASAASIGARAGIFKD